MQCTTDGAELNGRLVVGIRNTDTYYNVVEVEVVACSQVLKGEVHILLGAKAILLICAILKEEQIKSYIKICDDLGISALVEAHDDEEIQMAVRAKARIIGVNNRNLKDFSVDTSNSKRLRQQIPDDIIFVSESGISTRDDVKALEAANVDAVLIGETLMRATDKKIKLAELRGTLR